jgi:aminoglycoside phosphotransferase (APT) family kinase protein
MQDVSSSHNVYRATRDDGAEAIVKQCRPDGKRGLASELFVYRLAGWSGALGSALARPLHIDETAQLLALEALPGIPVHRGRMAEPGLMRRIGETLAVVHRSTLDQPIPPSPAAGILEVADHPDATGTDRPLQTQALMHRIAADPLLAEALRAAKGSYRIRCLIHGDLRPEHWMELPDASLRLIDWEMGGGGDPTLDLASAMVEPALEAIRWGAPQRDWLTEAGDAIVELAAGYRARSGPAALESSAERSHIVRLGAARLLHIACEWADSGALASAVEALVDTARDLLLSLDTASESLSK